MFIYLIVNRITKKYYVGQHKGNDLKKYLQQKLAHARQGVSGRSRLYNSMRKYPDASVWSIHALLSGISSKEELNQKEREFIAVLRSQEPEFGYNICRGGEGFNGPHSTTTRRKIAVASKRMWEQPEIRKQIIAKNTGQKRSPEFRNNLLGSNNPFFGKTFSKETLEAKSKRVRCVDTSEIFASVTEASKAVGGGKSSLSKAIKRGGKFFGRRYEFIT